MHRTIEQREEESIGWNDQNGISATIQKDKESKFTFRFFKLTKFLTYME